MSDGSGAILRNLVASDIPAAIGLSEEAGWNQTSEDWRMLIDLAPQGCLAIEADGQLAATTTLLCYGRRLAWIGMVLTRVSKRGRKPILWQIGHGSQTSVFRLPRKSRGRFR